MTPGNREPDGILLVDKPGDHTSHDVVARMRRKLQMQRIGHAGTLDPMATGLLILLVGKATKASQYLIGLDKIYTGRFELGKVTDTHDREGTVMATAPVPDLTAAEVQAAMDGFLGDQMQKPPMFSAIKKGGVPLYRLAREGQEVEREERFIRIARFVLQEWVRPYGAFELACSKGTYVRTVVHDLGGRLDCGATLVELRRTRVEKFDVADARTLDEIEALPLPEVLKLLRPVREAIPPQWT